MKNFIPVMITFVLLLGVIFVVSVNISTESDKVKAQQEELYDLQNKIEAKRQSVANEEKKLVADTTGLDTSRVSTDDGIAKNFASMVCTWGDGASYDEIRNTVMHDYGLTEDSDFMKVFLPQDIKVEQPDGSVLSYIDTHERNCQFEDIETYVTNINNGIYSYFAFVTFSASDKKGQESEGTAIMTYKIDANGVMSDIHGYTIAY